MNSIKNILRNEFLFLIISSIAIGLLSSVLIYGFNFYKLNSFIPGSYYGDGLAFLQNLQRNYESLWYFTNERQGFPWPSNFTETPSSDLANYLLLKILYLLTDSLITSVNIYLILGFSLIYCSFYLLLRSLKINRAASIISAIGFSLLPYHFLRLSHLFFTWYFVVSGYIYIYYKLFNLDISKKFFSVQNLKYGLFLFILANFGGYYALFSIFGFVFCFFIIYFKNRSLPYSLLLIISCITCVVAGIFFNLLPTLFYVSNQGINFENLNRLPFESEIYSFKISQLFIPIGYHFFDFFQQINVFYSKNSLLVNENASASLGIITCIGLVISLAGLLQRASFSSRPMAYRLLSDSRILLASLFILFFVFFASMGGLVSLYSLLISSTARGWNRVSIFIACFSLISLAVVLDHFFKRLKQPVYSYGFVLLSIFIFVLDQSPLFSNFIVQQYPNYEADHKYFAKIERQLPAKANVFQYPYQSYPGDYLKGMDPYAHSHGFLHSSQLRWNYGGMKWREGDWFYRHLALLPLQQQLDIIAAMGFQAIYIDQSGYCDQGEWIRSSVISYLNSIDPGKNHLIATHPDGHSLVFSIPYSESRHSIERANQYLATLGYYLDHQRIPQFIQHNQIQVHLKNRVSLPLVKAINGIYNGHQMVGYQNGIEADYLNPKTNPLDNFQPLCDYQSPNHLSLSAGPLTSTSLKLQQPLTIVFNQNLPKQFILDLKLSQINHEMSFDLTVQYQNIQKTISSDDLRNLQSLTFDAQTAGNTLIIRVQPKKFAVTHLFKPSNKLKPFELDEISIH